MRKTLVAIGVVLGLGCSGVGEKLVQMSGAELATGEDAEHPADFPLPPPEVGELVTSMKMGLAGTNTATVQYQLPADADEAAVLQRYHDHLVEAGHEVQRSDHDGVRTLVADLGGGAALTVALNRTNDVLMLSLVAITREP